LCKLQYLHQIKRYITFLLKKLRLEAGINVPEEVDAKRWYSHLKYFLQIYFNRH